MVTFIQYLRQNPSPPRHSMRKITIAVTVAPTHNPTPSVIPCRLRWQPQHGSRKYKGGSRKQKIAYCASARSGYIGSSIISCVTSYFRLHASYFDWSLPIARWTVSHAEARRRGVVRCFQFSILPYHNNCIGAARNHPYTSYFRLHASYFDSRFLLRLMPIHSEMHDVSRGGTETRSCALFSIFNSANTY